MTTPRPVLVVSNRGPVTFDLEEGRPVARRGAGGLISGLGPLVRDTDTIWIAAAMSDGDRAIAERGVTDAEGFRVRLLAFPTDRFTLHYDSVCNTALWFAHHGLFDPVVTPSWPAGWVERAWSAYQEVNAAFAAAVIESAPTDAIVLVQDYHLCLLAEPIKRARPDLRVVHFSHTPFAPPVFLRMLPRTVRLDLLRGLAAHDACGFHTERWVADFTDCCADGEIDPPATFVAPLGPDPADLAATVAGERFATEFAALDEALGDRRFLTRVDRIELSKNILRGFEAFDELLAARPDLHGRVVFGAYLYPSRLGVVDYDRYREAVAALVTDINHRYGTPDWTPIWYDPQDNYPRSIAALARADVVLVNPIRDGLNLVAKETMLVSQRSTQLVLSPEAGAWDELGTDAWGADPFDLGATADAILNALEVDPAEGERRHRALRDAVLARTPIDWFADQIAAGERAPR